MKLAAGTILFVSIAANGWASDGVAFQTDQLGMSLLDYCSKYDSVLEGEPSGFSRFADFGDVFDGWRQDGGGVDLRGTGEVLLRRRWNRNETIAGKKANEITYCFVATTIQAWDLAARPDLEEKQRAQRTYGEAIEFWRRWKEDEALGVQQIRLARITVLFNESDFDSVESILLSKYGAPDQKKATEVTNGLGAHFESLHLVWEVGEDEITVDQRHEKITQSQVSFTRHSIYSLAVERYGKLKPKDL